MREVEDMSDVHNLEYSADASAARYYFLKDSNDINIFIEDINKEYQYEAIFKQLLPNISLNAFFSSGGKPAMKLFFDEFGPFDTDNPTHPNVYIVDGDFDRIIFPSDMVNHPNYIYLYAYNIENYLIDEDACISFACGKLRKCTAETRNTIKFNDWKDNIVSQAKELFLVYCYLKAYYPHIKNVNNSAYIFLDADTGFERDGAFDAYKKSLKKDYNVDVNRDRGKLAQLENIYVSLYGSDFLNFICGKFLLTSLFHYLRTKGINKANQHEFEWWLINNINISRLSFLSDAINNAIEKQKEDVAI